MSDKITYEQPLNERLRTLLRLEQLMQRFRFCLISDNPLQTHVAVNTLMEIFNLTTRGDIKSDLMKELDRQISNIARLSEDPDVDQPRLQSIIDQQRALISKLHGMSGQLGRHLKDNDFLNAIRQRSSIPGGTCDFDLPTYHYWLSRANEVRHAQLCQWIAPYEQVQEAATLVLKLIRESAPAQTTLAKAGFYQQPLDMAQPFQIIRIDMPADALCYPEVSAGKHRFSIRFLELTDLGQRPKQVKEDIPFALACCAL